MNGILKKLIRPHYHAMAGYVSAGMESGKDESRVFLNANESPYELPGLEGLNRYPVPQPPELLAAYGKAYGVAPEHILATRGADESIKLLTRVFCEPHKDAILIHPPTFGIYKVDAHSLPVNVAEIPLIEKDGTFALDADKIIAAAQSGNVKIIYICSPNNPTGTAFAQADILRICKQIEDKCIVVVDEAYVEFSQGGSLAAKLGSHPNLMILRTMSKAYSMAGARMGVTLCADADFIRFMNEKVAEIYPLPKPSITAAIKALGMTEEVKKNVTKILAARDELKKALAQSPLVTHIYPSDANFLLVQMKNAKAFCAFAAENGMMLRDFSSKPGTENCLRITAGTPEQNEALLKLLKRFEAQ
ncbi:MAG TPA: histidinol-phosphate transaminase [Rhodospirillaceae bacterium]|nr:histidinol-phosphate transaminase [Rhodospirillaceae bacterium]